MAVLAILSNVFHLNNADYLTDLIVVKDFRTGQRSLTFHQTLGPRPTA